MKKVLLGVAICGALQLVQCKKELLKRTPPTTESTLRSVTYHVQVTDHRTDFSVNATAYFSIKRNAYRYDFKGGSKLFIYPKKGKGYYYYPQSNFPKNKINKMKCVIIRTKELDYLPSPFPTLQGFTYNGADSVYDIPAKKFKKISQDDDSINEQQMWVSYSEIIHPIREEIKQWLKGDNGLKKVLKTHITREYFGFVIDEQPNPTWVRPTVTCTFNEFTAITASAIAVDTDVPLELMGSEMLKTRLGGIVKTYQRGRRTPPFVEYKLFAALERDPLLLDLPWFLEASEDIVESLPKSFDWRDFGAVTSVRNQRQCGSCWAFAVVGSMEGAYFLQTNQLITLSEQALTDCAGSTMFGPGMETVGCFGGIERSGFSWIHHIGGIPPSEEYTPYHEGNGYCSVSNTTKLVGKLDGYYKIPNKADSLKVALVKLGPISVSIDSSGFGFEGYTTGVIKDYDCNRHSIDHAVLLVGYGENSADGPYWIIKNSWDTTWGLGGYGLISAKGNCRSILDEAYAPVLNRNDECQSDDRK